MSHFLLSSTALYFSLLVSFSCMHVIDITKPAGIAEKSIPIILKSIKNSGGTSDDIYYSIIESDGYYITVGHSYSDLSGLTGGGPTTAQNDFVIAKFNKSDLSLVHLNNLGGLSSDTFVSVIESGDYYITVGYSASNLSGLTGGSGTAGMEDFVIAKFNKSDLSLVHLNNPGGTISDYFRSVIESDGYYIAVGDSYSNLSGLTGGSATTGNFDFVIAKFDKSDLSLVTLDNWGGTSADRFQSIISSGEYFIIAGESSSNLSAFTGGTASAGNYDLVVAKIKKSDLSLVNLNNLGGSTFEYLYSIIESWDCYTAVGYSYSDLSGLTGGSSNSGNWDFVIAKFNKSDLSLVTINNLGGTGLDTFNSVVESGNYYIAAGRSDSDLSSLSGGSTCEGTYDFVLAKFNKSNLGLVEINNLGGTGADQCQAILESDNHFIAVGDSNSDLSGLTDGSATTGNDDFVIMKFGD